MDKTVSIITRTHNRPLFLRRSLLSIATQTYGNFEVILVNDAGNQATVDAIVSELDPISQNKIRIIHNPVSQGREVALNIGLAASTGPLITILDDDDTWEPEFLERTVTFLDSHPDYGAVAVRSDLVRERIGPDGTPHEVERVPFAAEYDHWSLAQLLIGNYIPTNSEVIRKSVIDEIGGWSGAKATQADWEFNLRLAASFPAGFLDGAPLSHWHHHIDAKGDLANSVIVEASGHLNDHWRIREHYLRESVRGNDPRVAKLGEYLLLADYFKQIITESGRIERAVHSSLNLAHVDLLKRLDENTKSLSVIHDVLGMLFERQAYLEAEIAKVNAAQETRISRKMARAIRSLLRH